MKKVIFSIGSLVAVSFLGACGQVVRSDEVGVLVRDMGSNAGVEPNEMNTGRHWPAIGSYIMKFPKRVQTETWAGDETGGPVITFTNRDGVRTAIGVSLQLRIDPSRASDLVSRYRLGLDEIIDGPVRRRVQGAFSRNGSNMTSEQLMTGGQTTVLISQVLKDISAPLANEGIIIENIEQVGGIALPKSIQDRINQTVEASQQAQTAEARVRLVTALAQQKVAEAKGTAEAMQIEGDALRANPEILKLREIENSKGICPLNSTTCVVGGGATVLR